MSSLEVPYGAVPVDFVPEYKGSIVAGITTYADRKGEYVIEGRKVTCYGFLEWTAATGVGNALISGLPLAPMDNMPFLGSVVTLNHLNGGNSIVLEGGTEAEMLDTFGLPVALDTAAKIWFKIEYLI